MQSDLPKRDPFQMQWITTPCFCGEHQVGQDAYEALDGYEEEAETKFPENSILLLKKPSLPCNISIFQNKLIEAEVRYKWAGGKSELSAALKRSKRAEGYL